MLLARCGVAFVFAVGPIVAQTEPAPAARVETAGAWIEWYRSLPAADLQWRLDTFLETQDPPPAGWLTEIAAALADPSADIRALACFAIASHAQDAAGFAPQIEPLLADDLDFVRFAAAASLAAIAGDGDAAPARFAALVESSDPRVRLLAARQLAGFDESGGLSARVIGAALAKESVVAVRRAQAEALRWKAQERCEAAAKALEPVLDDGDPIVRAHALGGQLAMHGFGGELARRAANALAEEDLESRYLATLLLCRCEHELVEPVRGALRARLLDVDPRIRTSALDALAYPKAGRKEWEAAFVAIGDPEPTARCHALMYLRKGWAGAPAAAALPMLARLIDDPGESPNGFKGFVANTAFSGLMTWGDEAAPFASQIAHVLQWGGCGNNQIAALYLGGLGPAARSQRAEVEALARQKHQGTYAVPPLLAAWALDSIDGNLPSAPNLREALATMPYEVEAAEYHDAHVDEMTSEPKPDPLLAPARHAFEAACSDERPAVRAAALFFLATRWFRDHPAVLASVVAAAKDPDPAVRRVAASLLAHLGADEHTGFSHDALHALLADPEASVRALAELAPDEVR